MVQPCNDDRYYFTLNFETGVNDLDLHARSQVCEKAKTSIPINPLTSRTIVDFPKKTTKFTKNDKNSSKGLKYIQIYILLKDIEQRI